MTKLTLPLIRLDGKDSSKNLVLKPGSKGPVLVTNNGKLLGWNVHFYEKYFSVGCENVGYQQIQAFIDKLDGIKKKENIEFEEGYSKGKGSFVLKENIIEESENFYIGKGGKSYSKSQYKPLSRQKKIPNLAEKLIVYDKTCEYNGRNIGYIEEVKQFLLDLQEYLK